MSRLIHPSRWVQGTVLLVIFLCGWTLVKFAWPTGEVLGKSLDTYLLQLGAPMPKDRKALVRSSNNTARDFSPIVFSSSQSNLPVWTDGLRMRARVATSRLGRILKVSPPYWDQQKRLMAMRTLGLIQPSLDQVDEVLHSGLRDRDQPFRMETAKLLASLNPPAFEVLQRCTRRFRCRGPEGGYLCGLPNGESRGRTHPIPYPVPGQGPPDRTGPLVIRGSCADGKSRSQ